MELVTSAATLGVGYALVGVAVAAPALATRALHLAVGPILVLGVLVGALLTTVGVPPVAAVAAAVAVGATVSALLEPLVLRPLAGQDMRGRDEIVRWLVGLVVVAAIVEIAVARWLVGRPVRPRPLLGLFGEPGLLAAVLVGAAISLLLGLALAHTRWGRRLRIVGGSRRAAELSGIVASASRSGAFAASGAVAVVAGLVIAPIAGVGAADGAGLTVRGVAAAIVLGVGGPLRAIAAGLALGAFEVSALWLLPGVRSDVAVGAAVVAVLVARGPELRREWGRAW